MTSFAEKAYVSGMIARERPVASGSTHLRQLVAQVSLYRLETDMRSFATLFLLVAMALVLIGADDAARAQQTSDCKLCREYQLACLKNHTRDACNSEYNICLKYCRKK